MRSTIIILFLMVSATAAHGMSDESIQRKEAMFKLCTALIDEYTRYLAGVTHPKNLVYLEREYQRCAEVVDEYEMLRQ